MQEFVHTDVTAVLRAVDAGIDCRISGPVRELRRVRQRVLELRPSVDIMLGDEGIPAYTAGVRTDGTLLYVSPTGNAAAASMGAAVPSPPR